MRIMAKPDLDWITPDLINAMIKESEEHSSRKKFLDSGTLCWKYYNTNVSWVSPDGVVISDPSLDNDIPVSFENRIKKVVDDGVSILLKNNPIVRHYPQAGRPQDADIADDMDRRLYALWDEGGASIKKVLRSALLESEISGLSCLKVVWNMADKSKSNDGEVMVRKLINSDIYIDPFATNDHRGRDARYIIHKTRQLPESILERFGSEGAKALGLRDKRGRDKTSNRKVSRIWSQFANTIDYYKGGSMQNEEKVDARVDVYEAWIMSIVDSASEPVAGIQIEEKDYPYGVVATMIGDYIVDITENPNAERRRVKEIDPIMSQIQGGNVEVNRSRIIGSRTHPFVLWYWTPTADDQGFNGVYNCTGLVEALIPVQISYNSISTNVEINARTLANPSISVVDGAIRDLPPDKITAEPGAIYRVHPDFATNIDAAIRFNTGSQMPAFVDMLRQDKKMSISELAGIHPAMVGLEPQGTSHLPGNTLAGLQEAAYGPLVGPIKELESAIYDISVLAEGLMQQYYKEGRIIEITNDWQQRQVEWSNIHITANLIRKVVAGSTTPIADIEKERRLADITAIVESALQTGNPLSLQNVMLYLQNINNPYAYDWIQLLQTALQQMQVQQQQAQEQMMMQAMGGQAMAEQGQQPAEDTQGLEMLAEEMGIDPQQFIAQLSASEAQA